MADKSKMKISLTDDNARKRIKSYSVFELTHQDNKQTIGGSYFYESDLMSSDKRVLVTRVKYLQQENANIKKAFSILTMEKEQLEEEHRKEQNRYMLTINELKAIISSIDKEKTLLDNKVSQLSEKLANVTPSTYDEKFKASSSSKENWDKERIEMLGVINSQQHKIESLNEIIESSSHRYETELRLLNSKIKIKKQEIKQLKGLLSLQTENIDLGTLPSENNLSLVAELETAGIITTLSRISTTQTDPNRIVEAATQVNGSLFENTFSEKLLKLIQDNKLSGQDRMNRRSMLNVRNREAFKIPEDVMLIVKKQTL
jgi:hypothetical protein